MIVPDQERFPRFVFRVSYVISRISRSRRVSPSERGELFVTIRWRQLAALV
jgi:hypothetical protein